VGGVWVETPCSPWVIQPYLFIHYIDKSGPPGSIGSYFNPYFRPERESTIHQYHGQEYWVQPNCKLGPLELHDMKVNASILISLGDVESWANSHEIWEPRTPTVHV